LKTGPEWQEDDALKCKLRDHIRLAARKETLIAPGSSTTPLRATKEFYKFWMKCAKGQDATAPQTGELSPLIES